MYLFTASRSFGRTETTPECGNSDKVQNLIYFPLYILDMLNFCYLLVLVGDGSGMRLFCARLRAKSPALYFCTCVGCSKSK